MNEDDHREDIAFWMSIGFFLLAGVLILNGVLIGGSVMLGTSGVAWLVMRRMRRVTDRQFDEIEKYANRKDHK